jgi:cytidylate kinase
MYRAVTVAARRHGLDITDESTMGDYAESVTLQLGARVLVNGEDVTSELRTDQTNRDVSVVATLARVRHAMVAQQRAFAHDASTGVVVEGRDITTVVFPDARFKLYVTASAEARSLRRWRELQAAGADADLATITAEMIARDTADAARASAPMRPASDAILLDTTRLDAEASFQAALALLGPMD